MQWRIQRRGPGGRRPLMAEKKFFRDLYSTANDPETANDPQNGPQMILDRKWSPKSTANDPERKIGMA